jgi:hypothetical protein
LGAIPKINRKRNTTGGLGRLYTKTLVSVSEQIGLQTQTLFQM